MAIERKHLERYIHSLVFGPPHARITDQPEASGDQGRLVDGMPIPRLVNLTNYTFDLYKSILDNEDLVSTEYFGVMNRFYIQTSYGGTVSSIWRGKGGKAIIHINANFYPHDDPTRKAMAILEDGKDPKIYRDSSVKLNDYSPLEDVIALSAIGEFAKDQQWIQIVDEDLDHLIERGV